MVEDDIYSGLPEEPELAFLALEKIYRTELNEQLNKAHENWQFEFAYKRYSNLIRASAEVLLTDKLPSVSGTTPRGTAEFLLEKADALRVKINLKLKFNRDKTTMVIRNSQKSVVHMYISHIREEVAKWDIKPAKKEAIFNKLNGLAAEVDRDRTRLDIIADTILTITATGGEALENLEPLRKWLDPLSNLLGKERNHQETKRIAYEELKQLEHKELEESIESDESLSTAEAKEDEAA